MNKKVLLAATSITLVILALATVTASISVSQTPLYTLRMEQASSKKNFLPTEVNTFSYATINVCNLNYDIPKGHCEDVIPQASAWGSCAESECRTCWTWGC